MVGCAPRRLPSHAGSPQGADGPPALADFSVPALVAANINPTSFLATDYLNHFNEAAMLLELAADAPELLDELRNWAPKSYADHFHDSQFAGRDLACRAYEASPPEFRLPFELTVRTINRRILRCLAETEAQRAAGRSDAEIARDLHDAGAAISRLIATAGAIINGHRTRLRNEQVVVEAPKSADTASLDQGAIDALFD